MTGGERHLESGWRKFSPDRTESRFARNTAAPGDKIRTNRDAAAAEKAGFAAPPAHRAGFPDMACILLAFCNKGMLRI